MDATLLVLTIIFANGIETRHERTAFPAICHGQALHMAKRAAARGWTIRYSCTKSIVGNLSPAKADRRRITH